MSDKEEEQGSEKPFCVDRPKQGRATCKKCKQKCDAGELRIAKLGHNPFGSGKMKQWHHVSCLFEQFLSQRLTTQRLDDPDDLLDGWDQLNADDKQTILDHINECEKKLADKFGDKYVPKSKKVTKTTAVQPSTSSSDRRTHDTKKRNDCEDHRDNSFREFRRLVADVTNESSYLEKSAIIKKMFTCGTDGIEFKGNIIQWSRLLLPGVVKRVYNLQSKQLIKLFSVIFETDRDEMLEHLQQGDIGETIQHFFEHSNTIKASKKGLLSLQDVDDFLEELSQLTKEDDQMDLFKTILKKCTGNDLKTIIRLIKHDLRMNAGAKHVLDAVHSDAYEAFQASRDLNSVLNRILGGNDNLSSNSDTKIVKATISVMTPILPMLAEACKSVEQAMKKCPNGMYSEIKYDGERVQVHKHGKEFKYFSRSLKPVLAHKVNHFKEFLPRAFPHANDLILDSEVLLIDTTNGKPLPFGSLGVHQKEKFKDANVCLFVFDCIFYNGESLIQKSIKERKKILNANMVEIPNRVMFSEMEFVAKAEDLTAMITKVLKLGLEGLVLKNVKSIYEPGKRHWLKVKKDYLCDGAMADTADLIVLGAWFGTGKKGGMMSIFLMGCYDKETKAFYTVTKVHTGHDDKTLLELQTELDMIKMNAEVTKVPFWLKCTKTMVPDFVARDPKKQPVWEIAGAEFTKHDVHTADGISIRFPRVTKIRSDKNWETATSLQELKVLFKKSKENTDITLFMKNNSNEKSEDIREESKTKRKNTIIDTFLDTKRSRTSSVNGSESEYFPIIFKNIKLLPVGGAEKEYHDLLRHFIGVGGVVLESNDWNLATHVLHGINKIHNIPEHFPRNARHITIDWVKDSIGNEEIQDTRPYTVQWIPF